MTLFAGGLGGIESEEGLPRKMPWEATRLPTPHIRFSLRQAL